MTKYGTSPSTDNLLWTIMVAWDGTYTGANEACYAVALETERGRDHLVKPGGDGFEPMKEGKATIILDNSDGRYDPWNTSSPLYPNVRPGKFVRILVKNGNTGANYPVMRGVIDNIVPISGGREQVRITVIDGIRWLRDRNIYIGLHQDTDIGNTGSSNCVSLVLAFADWPTSEWAISVFQSVDQMAYWWAWQEKAFNAICNVVDAEVGHFFIDREGIAVFRGRDYTWTSTYTITESQLLKEIILPLPWEVVRNIVRVYSYPKTLVVGSFVLWRLRDIPAIANGATFEVYAQYRYDSQKVCGTDVTFGHTVNTQAGGGGDDLTGDCPLTYGEISEGTLITIVNNSGQNGYITELKATGSAIYGLSTSVFQDEDTTSQASYGPRVFTIDTRWQEDSTIAKSLVDQLVDLLKNPTLLPIIQIEARPTYQFSVELLHRITIDIPTRGIDEIDYRIGKIEHKWLQPNGQAVRTRLKLEPYYVLS